MARTRPAREAAVLLGGWAAAALGLYGAFRAGLDNFPLLYVAAAVGAGLGLATRPWATGLAVVGWLAYTGVTAVHDVTGPPRPDQAGAVARLLDATCPARSPTAPCVVVADDGLFAPRPEEPGRLELFLLREDAVRVTSLRETRPQGPSPAAFATWSCGAQPGGPADAKGGPRDPRGEGKRGAVVARWRLAEVWSADVDGCTFRWMTPDGKLAAPVATDQRAE
jgi:hypothetical protein